NSPRVRPLVQLQTMIDHGPRQVSQRHHLERLFGPAVQRHEGVEEALQMPAETGSLQRQDLEDEALLRGPCDIGQWQDLEDEEVLQGNFAVHEAPTQFPGHEAETDNNTGLPDSLKTGLENLSGLSMDDVQVYYNSSKPAQLNALAYTQGTDI